MVGNYKEMLSSGYSRATAHMNSQQLWQHEQGLWKHKHRKSQHGGGEGAQSPPPPPPSEELLVINGFQKKDSRFPLWCSSWDTTHTPVDGPTSMLIQAALSGFTRLKKKSTWSWERKVMGDMGGARREEMRNQFDWHTMYAGVKFSNSKKGEKVEFSPFSLTWMK